MADLSIDKQFDEIVKKKMMAIAKERLDKICVSAAKAYMEEIDNTAKFLDVTGNLYQSFAVGIYYNGNLINIVRVGGDDPLMLSLAKGQAFPFSFYYSGDRVVVPYVGETGKGGQWGPEEGEDFLQSHRPANMNGFSVVVVAGIDYAEFVESKEGHDVLSGLRDEAMEIFRKAV